MLDTLADIALRRQHLKEELWVKNRIFQDNVAVAMWINLVNCNLQCSLALLFNITAGRRGAPTIVGNTARGASSPANPAFTIANKKIKKIISTSMYVNL